MAKKMGDPRSRLYIISTPIGNLRDITLRAIDVLKSVDVLACEDTRTTKKLLSHYRIDPPQIISYHQYNETLIAPKIIDMIKSGKAVGLVSDAGTPGISDAGYLLVKKARQEGIEVVPVPGPSAFVAAVSVSGLPMSSVLFVGFLPRQKARKKKLKGVLDAASEIGATVVLYESCHRLEKLMCELEELAGINLQCTVCRELTKKFETVITGRLGDIKQFFKDIPLKGEFVICLYNGGYQQSENSFIGAKTSIS